jgi:hypothetical protein
MFSCGMFSALAARTAVRSRALLSAALCGDCNFPEQTGEYLAALGIERALLVLDRGPF